MIGRKENMRDYSMLDLFRQEVETQVTNLKQSLLILKRQPSLKSELEAAMRSLHALVGSAQIVEIEAAAELAGQMQAGLIAAGERSVELTQAQIDRLLHAGDLLVGMSEASEKDLEGWLAEHSKDLSNTQTAIAKLASIDDVEQTPTNYPIDSPPIEAAASTDTAPPAPSLPDPPSLIIGDSSMMELFRLEVETQATTLTNGLLVLENQPQSAQELEALMRAAPLTE